MCYTGLQEIILADGVYLSIGIKNVTQRGVSFVPTVLELDLQDVGSVGRILRVLGHHVQVSWGMLLKNTHTHTFSLFQTSFRLGGR